MLVIARPATGFVCSDFNSCLFWGMWQSGISGWAGSLLTSLSSGAHTGSIFTTLSPPLWLPGCPPPTHPPKGRCIGYSGEMPMHSFRHNQLRLALCYTHCQPFKASRWNTLSPVSNLHTKTWLLSSSKIFWGFLPKFYFGLLLSGRTLCSWFYSCSWQ